MGNACDADTGEQARAPSLTPQTTSTAPLRVAPSSASALLPETPSASAAPSRRAQLSGDERAKLASYVESLARGRRASRAADYPAAAAAFSAALELRPGDPRALAERGYAAYLAKDFWDAESDLSRAAQTTDDRRLRAQIFYNLGLVHEALGDDASSAFVLSNFLHATKAAAEKMVGRNPCPVEIDRTPNPNETTQYRDWLAFYDEFAGAFLEVDEPPKDNETARRRFCGESACRGPAPWLVSIEGRKSFLVSEFERTLSVTAVALTWQRGGLSFCYPHVEAEILRRTPEFVVVQAAVVDGEDTVICDPNGHAHSCSDAELAAPDGATDGANWIRGCKLHPYTLYRVFVLPQRQFALTLTRYDNLGEATKGSERLTVDVGSTELAVAGPGCSLRVPLFPALAPHAPPPSSVH